MYNVMHSVKPFYSSQSDDSIEELSTLYMYVEQESFMSTKKRLINFNVAKMVLGERKELVSTARR